MIYRIAVDTLIAQHFIATRFKCDATTNGTGRASAFNLGEVPGTCLKAIRLSSQGPNWTNLNCVAREIRTKWLVWECLDLCVIPTRGELDQCIASDFVGETSAAIAQDAALAIQQH